MARIYAVLQREHDGDTIFGLFSDKARADAHVKSLEESDQCRYATVIEFELDNPDLDEDRRPRTEAERLAAIAERDAFHKGGTSWDDYPPDPPARTLTPNEAAARRAWVKQMAEGLPKM